MKELLRVHQFNRPVRGTPVRWRWALVAVLALALTPWALATNTTGADGAKDGAGYTLTRTSAAPGQVPDISGTGTKIANWTGDGDNGSVFIRRMNGSFTFYGATRSSIYIGSNGLVTFDSAFASPPEFREDLPATTAPNNVIYAYGDDLVTTGGGEGVWYATKTGAGTSCGAANSNDCFVVQWKGTVAGSTTTVDVRMGLVFSTGQIIIEIADEQNDGTNTYPWVIGTENSTGTIGLFFKASGATFSGDATLNERYTITPSDTTPPSAITQLTAASASLRVQPEWTLPTAVDLGGVLVLRKTGSAPDFTPVAGSTYTVGDTVGTDNQVACFTESNTALYCDDEAVPDNGLNYYYKAFAYDTSYNYSTAAQVLGQPRSNALAKWSYTTVSQTSALAPVGVIPNAWIVAPANDKNLHRMRELDGRRVDTTAPDVWPKALGGVVRDRAAVGDVDPTAGTAYRAFVGADNGYVYNYNMDTGALAWSANARLDAGCAAPGYVQGTPAIIVDGYGNAANTGSSSVVVATRCGLNNNQILRYNLDTGAKVGFLTDAVNGYGRSSAAPLVLYSPDAAHNNMVFVPMAGDAGEQLVAVIVNNDGNNLTEFAKLTLASDILAAPVAVRRATQPYVLVGDASGTLYLLNPYSEVSGELVMVSGFGAPTFDGSIKGLAVTNVMGTAPNAANWVFWATDTTIHGIKLDNNLMFDTTTYWSAAIGAPSAPLSVVFTGGFVRVYTGNNDGKFYMFDGKGQAGATPTARALLLQSYSVQPGYTIGQPVLDSADGTQANQGLVVGTTFGTVHRLAGLPE